MTVQPWMIRVYVGALLVAAIVMRITGYELPLPVRVGMGVVVVVAVWRQAVVASRLRRRLRGK